MRLLTTWLLCCILHQESPPYKELFTKCGSEINWLDDLEIAIEAATAQKRLILWYVPKIEGKHMSSYRHMNYYMTCGPFTNPEIVDLINRKFIPLNMISKGQLGIKALDYMEPALVFISPNQKVVHKIDSIRTINDDFFYNQMLLVLAANLTLNNPSKGVETAIKNLNHKATVSMKIALSQEYTKDGDLINAKKILEEALKEANEQDACVIHYNLAKIFRLQRKSDESLQHLKTAKKTTDKSLTGDILTELGLVLLKSNRFKESIKILQIVVNDYSKCTRYQEALYHIGAMHIFMSNEQSAFEYWKKIAGQDCDSIWKWKAASNLIKANEIMKREVKYKEDITTGLSAITHCFEEICWLDEKYYTTLFENTLCKKDLVDNSIDLAISFLIKSQRSNGSWSDSRYIFVNNRFLNNVWMAITALCSSSLLEFRDRNPKAIDAVLKKSTEYLIDEKNISRGKTAKSRMCSEEIYSDCYRLEFFSKLLPTISNQKEKQKIKDFIETLVTEIAKQQIKGSWSHEYPNPFTTATVVYCLDQAKEIGVCVHQSILNEAKQALKSTRGEDGAFAYYARDKGYKVEGSAGRMPLCEMALYISGGSDIDSVELAINLFFKHIQHQLNTRKSDYHADAFGNAGFFFFHNFYPATKAVKFLKSDTKKKDFYDKFKSLLITMQEQDGAFVDSHKMGRSYATAMALLAFKNCYSQLP